MYLGDQGSSYPFIHQAPSNFQIMSKWNYRGVFAFLYALLLSTSIINTYRKEMRTIGGLVKYFQNKTTVTHISHLIIDESENEKMM